MNTKTFFAILSSLIIILSLKSFKAHNIEVVGKAIKLTTDQNLMYNKSKKTIALKGARIIAVKGKVTTYKNKIFIPIGDIKSPKIYSKANEDGIFKFNISPGEYTFFIIIDDKAYLNSFDGKGNFYSKKIDSSTEDLILTDDRDALY